MRPTDFRGGRTAAYARRQAVADTVAAAFGPTLTLMQADVLDWNGRSTTCPGSGDRLACRL